MRSLLMVQCQIPVRFIDIVFATMARDKQEDLTVIATGKLYEGFGDVGREIPQRRYSSPTFRIWWCRCWLVWKVINGSKDNPHV